MGSLRDLESSVGEFRVEELERKNEEEIIVMKKKKNYFRTFLVNFQQVLLGTKLCLLLPAIPLAILAQYYHFARVSIIFIHLFLVRYVLIYVVLYQYLKLYV